MKTVESRYAIYFVPPVESEFYRFGSRLLGYDCYTGNDIDHPDSGELPSDWPELATAARRYGFHATLKAPFRLAAGRDEASLVEEFRAFGRRPRDIPEIRPVVASLSGFVAIVAEDRSTALDALAADCERHFDPFRAPLSYEDRARRLLTRLTARQRANVDRWGYPYVFDDFRFHMTLTGPVPEDRLDAIRTILSDRLSGCLGSRTITVDRIALLRQDHRQARFRVLKELALTRTFGATLHGATPAT